jgi:hypothetical protein
MNWRRNEPSSPKKESVGKDIVPYPHVIVNCTVELKRLDPAMLEALQPQTQKKEVSSTKRIRKYSKEERENYRKMNEVYRNEITSGFNLLKKCVPGTKKLIRPDILMMTVKYIMELQNKVRELEKCKRNTTLMESTQLTLTDCDRSRGMERDSVPNTEQDCTHSAPREPRWQNIQK